ncbi:DNA primase [uncultured Rikenella sp.]|uniref:DNA primase n=1 Tax=uncultured Rikenella sp. TaxID=368003 RepID=UPI002628EA6B|nr:DNA primase [uncultured Rikenella sp.]
MIDRQTVDRIFAAANIVDVVSDFVTLKKRGVNYMACCPFHNEKTPSFVVSPSKGLYKCFGCGKGGNAVGFVMEHEGLSYVEALKWVAKKYGIEVKEREQTEEERQRNDDRESMMVVTSWANQYFVEQLKTDEGRSIGVGYFRERGFTDATIAKFQLGYCPAKGDAMTQAALKEGYREEFLVGTGLTIKREASGYGGEYYDRFCGRVMFPVHSLAGRVIAFGGRTLRTDKKVAKYLNSPESEIYHKSNTLYGIYFAKKAITQFNRCILVEGYTDVLQMHQSGVENVVASSGTSLTVEQIKLIKRFTKNVTVIYDGDAAGIKASMRGIDMILREGLTVRCVLLPDGEDPDSFARAHNATELQAYIEEHEEDFISFKTRILLGDAAEDPIKRAEVIASVVESIATIPEAITRSVFIRECARKLEIDEDILIREVARKRVTMVDGQAGREAVDNRLRKEQFVQRQAVDPNAAPIHSPEGPVMEPAAPIDLAPKLSFAEQGLNRELEQLERELVGYLLKYGGENFDFEMSPTEIVSLSVAETIIGDLEMDRIEMHSPLYRQVYEEYVRFYREENRAPEVNRFINHPSPEVAALAVDLLTEGETYAPSRMWERYEIRVSTERERLGEAIPKAITIYKSKVVSSIIASLQKELLGIETMEEAQEIVRRLDSLNELRKNIYEKYLRTV